MRYLTKLHVSKGVIYRGKECMIPFQWGSVLQK
ncbi:hypothetical protein T01_4311 [Trichinella spiralis]|uniref:Uncharacterized protein n=1 Tax=Trichinella spiralis TaxID=6334 RepID=A0A0V0YZY5_TRISP|nr:hypothetical protein T01_4311 [Trichinella spiralis]